MANSLDENTALNFVLVYLNNKTGEWKDCFPGLFPGST